MGRKINCAIVFFSIKTQFMKKTLLIIIIILPFLAKGQLTGVISDMNTGEPLIGATILYSKGKGTASNLDGQYSINLPKGEYEISASYVGYQPFKTIIQYSSSMVLNIELKTVALSEVEVVSDIAIDRKTPIAFSTIPAKKILSQK